ncbi:MAG TPA: ParB/RepB/Spo0J family partition protein [Anaerolineaceae bacterium]|nr:ParB/RepB/Spo0J family partition protein [Anaerolineaceae bacterium]
MARKTGLGKGLDALIPRDENAVFPGESSIEIPIEQIGFNPRQPRTQMDAKNLKELADSIRQFGILQPLLVRREPGADRYVLIAGERRLRAAALAGLTTVPVVIRSGASDEEQLELALIENLQRSDLTPFEEAEAFNLLHKEFGLTHEEIARRVGKARSTVTNAINLLNLVPAVRQALIDGLISEGHARALLGLESPVAQESALGTVLKLDFNVRQTEALIRKMKGERPRRLPQPASSPEVADLEQRLRARLGAPVTLRRNLEGKGTLLIRYYSDEELNAIIAHILDE